MTEVKSEQAMRSFGERLGVLLEGGETIELIGDVGAGKTTLVRGLARGMDIEETVQSPSFTINRTYDTPHGGRLIHYDFYRLTDPGIMTEELQEATNDPSIVAVIEWADSVEHILPTDRLTIAIATTDEHERRLTLSAGGEQSRALLEKVS